MRSTVAPAKTQRHRKPTAVNNNRFVRNAAAKLASRCLLFVWGGPLGQRHLVLVGQTLRLRAAPSRALRILQNCRRAGRGAPRKPRARPRGKCPNLGKLSGIGPSGCGGLSGRRKVAAQRSLSPPQVGGRCPRRLTSQISSAQLSAPSVRGADKSL